MPTERHYAPATVMLLYLGTYAVKRHRIEVPGGSDLYASKVKAHDSRIIAARLQHIASSGFVLPVNAIHGVILMTEHAALLLQ